jgi:hypothetical protein
MVLAPKRWTSIAVEDEGSESLLNCIRKGFVSVSNSTVAEAAVAIVLAPEPVKMPAKVFSPVSAPKLESAEPKAAIRELTSTKPNRKGR